MKTYPYKQNKYTSMLTACAYSGTRALAGYGILEMHMRVVYVLDYLTTYL